jgi:uncharacterized protein (DUF1015 family)
MAQVFPFAATMPPADKAKQVSAPPYDVMNSREAAQLAEGNPLSFLRVSRPEIELPEGIDLHADAVYEKAAANYRRLCEAAPLNRDDAPTFYVYSLVMNGHRQTGIVAAAAVDDYDHDVIKKHEKTRQDKEDDRTRHITTLNSQTGPVFLTYRDHEQINRLVEETMQGTPVYDFTADDGVSHTIWRTAPAQVAQLEACFTEVPCLYIADGHHRAASASRTRQLRQSQNPNHTGNEEYNRFLAVIFPATQLRILPYNRVVKDLNGLTADELIAGIKAHFSVAPTDKPAPTESGHVHMYLDGAWWELALTSSLEGLSASEQLDVSRLQELVLAPLLGIDDPRTSSRVDFVGGIRGTGELEDRVNRGEAAVAFSMAATTVEQLMAISNAGEIMPPKSTWFEPKLRDGLLIHDI